MQYYISANAVALFTLRYMNGYLIYPMQGVCKVLDTPRGR